MHNAYINQRRILGSLAVVNKRINELPICLDANLSGESLLSLSGKIIFSSSVVKKCQRLLN